MKQILKSFFKLNILKAITSFSFIVFIVFFSSITLGLIASPLQIISFSNNIKKQQNSWEYSIENNWNNITDESVYDYFEKDNGLNNIFNKSLLNKDAKINNINIYEYLRENYDNLKQDNISFNQYIGSFIKNNVFSFKYLYEHKVYIADNVLIDFDYLINKEWHEKIANEYGQMYNLIFNNLTNDKFKTYTTFKFEYDYSTISKTKQKIILQEYSMNNLDNVILYKNNKNITHLNNDEIIIDSKYAEKNNYKIGEIIRINSFVSKDKRTKFNNEYKIKAFGIKMSDVFKKNDDIEQVFIYLNHEEMSKYINYLWENDNHVYFNDGTNKIENNVFNKTFIDGKKTNIDKTLNELDKTEKIKLNNMNFKEYNNEFFNKKMFLYKIESIVLIFIGILLLLLSMLFINYTMKQEINSYANIFSNLKANGYSSFKLALIQWTRTIIMLIVGFSIGFAIGIFIQHLVYNLMILESHIVIKKTLLKPIFIIFSLIIVPLFISLINLISMYKTFSKPVLEIGIQKFHKNHKRISNLFIRKNIHSNFMLINKMNKKNFIIFILFLMTFLTTTFELNSKRFLNNVSDKWTSTYGKIQTKYGIDYKYDWYKTNNNIKFKQMSNFNISLNNIQKNNELKKEQILNYEDKELEKRFMFF